MVSYDAGIIQKFAKKLYARADLIVFLYTLVFVTAGVLLGARARGDSDSPGLIVVGVLVGGVVGYLIGEARAFMLRLQAQTALCQVEIEHNTRRAGQPVTNPVEAGGLCE